MTTQNHLDDMTNRAFDLFPPRLRQALSDGTHAGRAIALCAEPGMGKLALALAVMDYGGRQGAWTMHHSMLGRSSAEAADSLVELSQMVAERAWLDPRPVVVVSGIPAPDECDVERQSQAIGEMTGRGCLVVLCLRPEAEQLVEELPHVLCLRASDLLHRLPAEHDACGWNLTHGIPALVSASMRAEPDGQAREEQNVLQSGGYRFELSSLVESSLRSTLPDEDRRVRLAMILLGSGVADEIVAVADRLGVDTLDWMERDAPLFGVDCLAGTFSCAGVFWRDGLRCCVKALRLACQHMPDVVVRATKVLASRGDLHRAAITCGLCDPADAASLGCEWGVEFVCAGEDALVRKALEAAASAGVPSTESLELSKAALALVSDPITGPSYQVPPVSSGTVASPWLRMRRRHIELLQACRDIDRGFEPGRIILPRADDDEVACALAQHALARKLLYAGKFSEAHDLLVDAAARHEPDTLASALLSDDYAAARVLIGEEPTLEDRDAAYHARRLFESMGSARLRNYHEACEQLLSVVAARADRANLAPFIAHAERMGDHTARAALLLAAAIADIRIRSYARAHVHVRQVIELAGGPASEYLEDVARLVDALIWSHLDDDASLRELAASSRPSLATDIAKLATHRAGEGERPPVLSVLSRMRNPKDELWLLNVMFNDFDEDSAAQAFRLNAPRTWASLSRSAVRKAEQHVRMTERVSALRFDESAQKPSHKRAGRRGDEEPDERSPRVEIRVLGGFDILFDGVPMASRLGRRMVKPYLLLLLAARQHELGVFEVIESLWPGSDLAYGRQKIYNANSELRRLFRSKSDGVSLVDASRGEGIIRLNTSVVRVDADEFARGAYEALQATGDDERAVQLTAEAAMLYSGDFAATNYDARGLIAARRDELRHLYADVSIAGSAAALREGRTTQAVQMAQGAYAADDMREDGIYALIESLKTAGRGADACAVYDEYARRLQLSECRPPSPNIRKLVEDVYLSVHGGKKPVSPKERLRLTSK